MNDIKVVKTEESKKFLFKIMEAEEMIHDKFDIKEEPDLEININMDEFAWKNFDIKKEIWEDAVKIEVDDENNVIKVEPYFNEETESVVIDIQDLNLQECENSGSSTHPVQKSFQAMPISRFTKSCNVQLPDNVASIHQRKASKFCKVDFDAGDTSDESEHSYAPSLSSKSIISSQKSLNHKKTSKYVENLRISKINCSSNEKKEIITVQSLKYNDFRCRKNYCPFCFKLLTNLPRHMINKHKEERLVQNFWSYPEKSKERAILLEKLRKLGNFRHNVNVIKNKKGQILPAYRPKKNKCAESYVSCNNCLGFFPKYLLWKHNANCEKKLKLHLQGKSSESTISLHKSLHHKKTLENNENLRMSKLNCSPNEKKEIITVQSLKNNDFKVRKNYCPFCLKLLTDLLSHLMNKHKAEINVHKFLSYPKKSKERATLLEELKKLGNLRHNVNVIKNKKGQILPACRPKDKSGGSYVPCNSCLRFFSKSLLLRHNVNCKKNYKSHLQGKSSVATISLQNRLHLKKTLENIENLRKLKCSSNEKKKIITVQGLKNSEFRCRKNYCPFCLKLLTNLPRHMINKHKEERLVQNFWSYPEKSKERAILLEKLRNLGNFRHNVNVIKNKKGQILPAYRPKKNKCAESYVSCNNCLGFFPKSLIWKHNANCEKKLKLHLQGKSSESTISLHKSLHHKKTLENNENLRMSKLNCSPNEKKEIITVQSLKNNDFKVRKNYCPFCLKLFTDLLSHMINKHKAEINVHKFLSYPKKSKERATLLEELKKLGNLRHNVNVIKNKKGQILPACRPKDKSGGSYVPCNNCLGFFPKSLLLRHNVNCKKNYKSHLQGKSSVGTISLQNRLHLKKTLENIENLRTKLKCSSNEKKKIITVQGLKNSEFRCRKNYCPFCLKLLTNLPRHMINKHKEERLVQNFWSYPEKSKERAILLEKLRNLGNFRHNVNVIKNKKGQILPAYRPKKNKCAKSYVSCNNCLGFFPKYLLWKHNANCEKKLKLHLHGKSSESTISLHKSLHHKTTLENNENLRMSKLNCSPNEKKEIITVQSLKSNDFKVRKNYCPFCLKLFTNLSRHMINKHKAEINVQKLLSYPKKSKEKSTLLEELKKLGNFRHKVNVIKNKKGQILPAFRPKDKNGESYVPCNNCLGFFPKSLLLRHNVNCKKSHLQGKSSVATISLQNRLHLKKALENIENLRTKLKCSSNEKKKIITVQGLKNSEFRCRINYCPFCLKFFTDLPRHMINKHKAEINVQKFLSYPKKSKERATLLEELKKLGNFRHNVNVIKNKKGQIMPVFRPKEDKSAESYVPCKNCLGFFPKSVLWRHNARCKKNHKSHLQGKRIIGHGMNLLLNNTIFSEQFLDKVIGPMNTDDVNLVIRNDTLILKLGESMFLKDPEQWKLRYARDAMRYIGRLLIYLRKIDPSVSSLRDAIHPKKFQSVVLAAKNIAGFDGVNSFDHASVVLKLGINMKKCAEILHGISIDEVNEELNLACEQFIKRHDSEWANSISSSALKHIRQKKFNKPKFLSVIEDFQKLNTYITKNTNEVLNKLSCYANKMSDLKQNKKEFYSLWMRLMNLTLSSIILFNRKISGEAERIMIHQYQEGIKLSPNYQDLQNTLPNSEQLSHYFYRIEVPGRKGNKILIILSKLHVTSVELILKFRSDIGVNSENNFIFARPHSHSLNTICSSKVLRATISEANLKNQENILSSTLHKHITIMSQLLNLAQPELKELCKLMGHDMHIHTTYYCLSDDAFQLGKLTKLIIAAQNGQTSKYRNKSLEAIELKPDEFIPDDDVNKANTANDDKNDKDNGRMLLDKQCIKIYMKRGKVNMRRPWSEEEKVLTLKHFKAFLHKQKLPGKEECEKFLCAHKTTYKGRNWLHIKNFVRNKIVSNNKIA